MKKLLVITGFLCFYILCKAQINPAITSQTKNQILPGAYHTKIYLPYLLNKRIAVLANQASVIANRQLVDTLQKLHVHIVKIFCPEHGFRGEADAGENVYSYTDKITGIKVISLYGKKLKPSAEDLKDVDALVFDIQDIGVRFYTYISTLQNFMEAAIENNKPLLILDRPNPNGFYVDGPVLDTAYKSFIGMQPVPVVYGMTIGEYARMLIGENRIQIQKSKFKTQRLEAKVCIPSATQALKQSTYQIIIIPCKNYTHKSRYILFVKPSPNLPDMRSIYWYPSTCFFEGTVISEGRGTNHPFEIFGHPQLPHNLYSFMVHSTPGAKDPKFNDEKCYGWNITNEPLPKNIELKWLLMAYKLFPEKDSFFIKPKNNLSTDYFFNKLAGNSKLMKQIINGKSEKEIRKSWQPEIDEFKKIRKKYLLYEDFE